MFSTEPLQKAIELSGFYGPQARLISYGANGSGPTVALVSNYPVLESVSIPDFPPEAMLTTEAGALPIKVCDASRGRGLVVSDVLCRRNSRARCSSA